MESLKQMLAKQPFLKGLNPTHLQYVAECATEVEFDSGEQILLEGQEANQFYLIHRGKVGLGTFVPGRGLPLFKPLMMVNWSVGRGSFHRIDGGLMR